MICLHMLAHCHRTGTRIQLVDMSTAASNDAANVMEASLYERSPIRRVIKPDAMQALLNRSAPAPAPATDRCPITQAEFAEGDAVLVLPCGHAFMQDAIQLWLENESAECPVCRCALPSHEITIE